MTAELEATKGKATPLNVFLCHSNPCEPLDTKRPFCKTLTGGTHLLLRGKYVDTCTLLSKKRKEKKIVAVVGGPEPYCCRLLLG